MPEVLIVDDDPDIRSMLVFSLGDQGFSVREANGGVDALDQLAEKAPDCMVLDLMMPSVDGFTVLETCRERGLAPGHVVILTARADQAALVRGWELGAEDYLTKPIDPDILAVKLHRLLAAGTEPRPVC